jgi:AcrR family transcriptional regulator
MDGWDMARTPSSKPKPYHHGELREALVAAGRRLLEERGLRGFTLRECARRAEVSHAAPAHHFDSIDDLLAEIATRGYRELMEAMQAEARRAKPEPTTRMVAQGIGYLAFAAAHPALFQLMFTREASRFETPGLAAVAREAYQLHLSAVEAVIPQASPEVRRRMADFAWATIHGFITLVLEGQIGEGESSRALKTRSLAVLAAMVETVVRVGSASDQA